MHLDRQVSRIPHTPALNEANYVDDHALAQITTALPLLGLPRGEQMRVTRSDGEQITASGFEDPQAMRMILLQILTGRRSSEIRHCDFGCLSPATGRAAEAAQGEQIARFRYAQTKIDIAPDTILVDSEVAAIIEEQQQWIRDRFPAIQPRHLFLQLTGNRSAAKPYPSGTYTYRLREFSKVIQITDSKNMPVRLSHTHRFRHTRLTRLAELGLPVHVLQRYAGHATPTMTMHYIAQREEHAEQAFLATVKLKGDGTRVVFSREDHDAMHLLGRADRILPNGWCTLPPKQLCDKGNACLSCSKFVTDSTHAPQLRTQLTDTETLIEHRQAVFTAKYGAPMDETNIWLHGRQIEVDSLNRILLSINDVSATDKAVRGPGTTI